MTAWESTGLTSCCWKTRSPTRCHGHHWAGNVGSFAGTLKGTLLWFKAQEILQQRESKKCFHSQGLFTPQSVSQSKCLLNFKLNGHLKGDCSPPTVKKNETFGIINAESWLKIRRLHGILPHICKHFENCSVSLPGKTSPCPAVFLKLWSYQHRDHWESNF